MIRSKTVFVIGAGASVELGLPSGKGLLGQIREMLDIKFEDGLRMTSGSHEIYSYFDRISGNQSKRNVLLGKAWKIRDATFLGLSIDNLIHQFSYDQDVVQIAKIAIFRSIATAERKSKIFAEPYSRDKSSIIYGGIDTWLGPFCQILFQDATLSDLRTIFDNVSIVSFNYDRTILHYLPYAIENQFGTSIEESRDFVNNLKIYHPYGSLGLLPWQSSSNHEFGSLDGDLINDSRKIRTFTESIEDYSTINDIRLSISNATQLVFLGFGYHRQNIAILSDSVAANCGHLYGTSYEMSVPDVVSVQKDLEVFIREEIRAHGKISLPSLKCADFLRQYSRVLTS